jgi:ABC-type uncharacterized transport system involved in gliding motility auxiliary subunit
VLCKGVSGADAGVTAIGAGAGAFFLKPYSNSISRSLTHTSFFLWQSIAPLLIILRVAQGQALERDTLTKTLHDSISPSISFHRRKAQGDSYYLSALSSTTTKHQSSEGLQDQEEKGVKVTTTTYSHQGV